MTIPDAVRAWFASLSDTPADPSETPEPVGKGEDPTTEVDEKLNPEPTADAPEATDAAADENTDTTPEGESRTAPEPTTPLTDTERDALNKLAAENEALREENTHFRNRIAELGGDAALGIVEEEVVEQIADEPEDEYDPEADLADQESELARLRGE